MTNVEQRDAWNGESGAEWVRLQDRYDRALERWGQLLAEVAAAGAGERVLDVGCGCGATTLAAAARCGPAGLAVGVDLSEPMVARARRRAAAAGIAHVRFLVGDCQVDDLGAGAHDVVISRFGVMFFDDPVAAFANMRRAVRPGGRLAVLVWGPAQEQDWFMVPAAAALEHVPPPDLGGPGSPDDLGGEGRPGMFSLAAPEVTTRLLEAAGWRDVAVERHRRPMVLGGGTVDDTVEFLLDTGLGRALLADVDEETAGRAAGAVRTVLAEHLTPNGVELPGTAWAVTARNGVAAGAGIGRRPEGSAG